MKDHFFLYVYRKIIIINNYFYSTMQLKKKKTYMQHNVQLKYYMWINQIKFKMVPAKLLVQSSSDTCTVNTAIIMIDRIHKQI